MRRAGRASAVLFAICVAAVVHPIEVKAQEREYCTDRPGIGTPTCTMAPGRASLEVGLLGWTLEKDAAERQDQLLLGDGLVRYGIADHAEVQLGWSALGLARTRDRLSGAVDHRSGTGDVTLALRRNLIHPDGSGFSAAVMPFVSLPVGRTPFGAGDWSAGLLVPLSYDLSDKVGLSSTSEIDAAVNEDSHGRHLAMAETVGASLKLSDAIIASAEYQVTFDRDPQAHSVAHLSGVSVGWHPNPDLELDVGANAGLDHDAPDAELYFGVSRRF